MLKANSGQKKAKEEEGGGTCMRGTGRLKHSDDPSEFGLPGTVGSAKSSHLHRQMAKRAGPRKLICSHDASSE